MQNPTKQNNIKRGLHISKHGIIFNGKTIQNIDKIIPPKPEKKKQPKKKNNNKVYRDFCKIARKWDKYSNMSYREFLCYSKKDYEKWKVGIACNEQFFSSSDEDDSDDAYDDACGTPHKEQPTFGMDREYQMSFNLSI
jgi:hypothetical protein